MAAETISFSVPAGFKEQFKKDLADFWPAGTSQSQAFREMRAFFLAHRSANSATDQASVVDLQPAEEAAHV